MTDKTVQTPHKDAGQAPAVRQMIYDNQLVRVVGNGEITPGARVKIQWDGGRNGLVERYVDAEELTPLSDSPSQRAAAVAEGNDALPDRLRDIPKALLDAVRLAAPLQASELNLREIAFQQYQELKVVYQRAQAAVNSDGWHSVAGLDTAGPVRRELLRVDFVERRELDRQGNFQPVEWRITAHGCRALGLPLLPGLPDDAPRQEREISPVVEAPAVREAVAEPARPRLTLEIKTLMQPLGADKNCAQSDTELGEHLMDRWRVLDIQIIVTGESMPSLRIQRVVTLQRWPEPEPVPQPEARESVEVPAATEPEPVQRIVEPVGPEVILTAAPSRQPQPVLNLGPYGRSIRDSGLDETLAIADQAAADKGRAAFERALTGSQIAVRPLIPAAAGGDPTND